MLDVIPTASADPASAKAQPYTFLETQIGIAHVQTLSLH
jgi:hypothetical protein